MKNVEKRSLLRLAACGLVGGTASIATAQPYVINQPGATLLQNFLTAPAATNEFFDIDGDGTCPSCPAPNNLPDQLAPFGLPPAPGSPPTNQFWLVQYWAVGSVNGFQNLVDYGRTFATGADCAELCSSTAALAFHNRQQYITNGLPTNPIFNTANPFGAPVRSNMPAGFNQSPVFQYTSPGTPSPGGLRVDMAPVDVPSTWAVQAIGGTPGFDRTPTVLGYGTNPKLSLNKNGTVTTFNHLLANLGTANLNTGSPTNDTIFDTTIAFAPIAPMTNLGTGMTQIDQSDLRHLFGTGRLKSGQNMMAVTRDSGSGTRNGFNNSIGLDPSWGVGENIGVLSNPANEHLLGPSFLPSNKAGSSVLEATVRWHRLAIGYTGAERAVNSTLVTGGRMEILAVRFDLIGGTEYIRPRIDTNAIPVIDEVFDNSDANSYLIGGPAIFAHFGDPKAAPAAQGGTGSTNPPMRNVQAAAYLNNVAQSVAAFVAVPGGSNTLFTPGEFLATQFLLVAATDRIQAPNQPTTWIPNPALNQALQDASRNISVFKNAVFQSFGTVTLNGQVPTREVGTVYSDGVPGGANYINQAGAAIAYGGNLTSRNRICGDFNGDGLRNLNDAEQMLRAYRQRNGGPAWVAPAGTGPIAGAPGTDAIIEVLGDFNGDGNFNAADVRYWGDGLAIDPGTGNLDRKKGFEAIDNAWQTLTGSNNFFGATIQGGGAYVAGASRFDVGGGLPTPGFAPVGGDGVIDNDDVDYVEVQFIGNPFVTGDAEWSNTGEAVGFDLSGDMTGDLIVNQADVNAIQSLLCYPDCNGVGGLTIADFGCFQTRFVAGEPYADCNGVGGLTIADFGCFQTAFVAGCP